MRWLMRDLWKAGIVIAGVLLLLLLIVWLPVSVGSAQEVSQPAIAITPTVQATPTEDATVTALNKEKLAQEVQQLKNQNEQLKNQNASDFFVWLPGWLRTNAAILLSTLIVVIGGLIGLFRWFGDRHSEREKRAEERFQSAVTGLGDEKEGAKIGAAILLRTFLRKGYKQFYTQTFDLAVAYLTPNPSEDPDGIPQSPVDPNTPLPLTTLRKALIVVFKEAFPLARKRRKKRQTLESSFLQKIKAWLRIGERFDPQSLDATGIQLDNAYLVRADLQWVWMHWASLREADLSWANLSGADLKKANLSGANLREADLSWAQLWGANLSGADLSEANLSGAYLFQADLSEANLREADLSKANLSKASVTEEQLKKTKSLEGATMPDGTKLP